MFINYVANLYSPVHAFMFFRIEIYRTLFPSPVNTFISPNKVLEV